jgi:hypothetical protein
VEIQKVMAHLRDMEKQRALEFESFQELISKVEAMTNSEEVKASEVVDISKVVREKVDLDIFELVPDLKFLKPPAQVQAFPSANALAQNFASRF